MGRSANSRNRVFVTEGEGIRTEAFDPSKMEDPSLIIYAPVRVLGNKTIVTNGDQTDTIYEGMDRQLTFEQSLRSREFEPDGPNYTPRISGIMHIDADSQHHPGSVLCVMTDLTEYPRSFPSLDAEIVQPFDVRLNTADAPDCPPEHHRSRGCQLKRQGCRKKDGEIQPASRRAEE